MSRYLQLNNGNKIPHIGFGTWELGRSQAANVVYHALKAGFRLIDTAYLYRNEKEVGEGIEQWLDEDPENNKRSEVFTPLSSGIPSLAMKMPKGRSREQSIRCRDWSILTCY